jgi:MFS family permease
VIAAIERLTGLERTNQGVVFLVGAGHGGTHWVAATFYLILPFITKDLNLSYAEVGALVASFQLAAFAANFGSGLVVDMTGRRVVFQVLSLALGGAALMAIAGAQSAWFMLPMVIVMGATNNLWHPPAIAFLSEAYPKHRGYTLSIHALGANVGDALAPLAAGALLLWFSWRGAAALNALPAFAIALITALLLAPRDKPHPHAPKKGLGAAEYFQGVKGLLKNRAIVHLSLMAGFRTMAQHGVLVFLPLYLAHVAGMNPLWMGFTVMALQVGGVVASPIAGTWSDRVGRRPVVLAGLTVATAMIVILTLIHNDYLFVAGVAFLGFFMYAVRPVLHSWMMDLAPAAMSGSATSVMFGVQSLFTSAMLAGGGVVADKWGLDVVFWLLAASMLAANVLVYFLPHHAPARDGGAKV